MQNYEDRERVLSEWLREVAEEDAAGSASPAVRARLLEVVQARRRLRRVSLMKMYALAAGLLVATAMPVWQLTTQPTVEPPPRTPISILNGNAEVATAFYPLTYSTVPVTQGNIVRLEVPSTAFAALGVEPIRAGGSRSDVVLADVLVGEDGLARAVRFVRTVTNENSQEQLP